MTNKKKVIRIILICLIICCIPFAIYHLPKYIEQKIDEMHLEREEQQKRKADKNSWYTEYLCIEGDFEITHNKVTVSNQTISESDLTVNICFYNFYKANDVSPELLLKEYENFCKNKGQWDNLELYMDFMYARDAGLEGSKIDKYTIPISEYKIQLHKYLNVKGYDFDKITKKDLEECCNEVLSHKDELYLESKLADINRQLGYGEIGMGILLDESYKNETEYHGDYRAINKNDEYIYYYQELDNWMTGQKGWRLVKIDVYGEDSSLFFAKIGNEINPVKEALTSNFNYNYCNVEDDYLEYYNDLLMVKAEFKDDACEKLSIEIMETEFTKGIGVKTIEDGGRVILPLDDAENFFEGSIEVPRVLTPDENGHITVVEPRSLLNTKTDDPDELLAKAMETYEVLDINLVDAYMNDDNSVTLVYDEEGLEKYITTTEEIYNQRLGWISNDVSISKDFTKMYIYVNDSTELIDIGLEMVILTWHSALCQIYSGVKCDEWHIDLYFVNNVTGERLLELKFAEKHPGFNMSQEQWEQLFEQ
ncbi:MAG: hypothetical protein IJZ96_10820 [Lachnospiraceae bacterium]|nr:hypothetical protein [Lachnospiraceae bacterium]